MVQKNSVNDFAIVICGPTGSGKSQLAVQLSKELNGEIISADSIAIYKGLDIGAAKPDENMRRAAVHHMIDIVEPFEEFSVAEYKEQSRYILNDILKARKTPIICGGTGYYIDALLYDFSYGNCPKNQTFRDDCEKIIEQCGIQALYEKLKSVDPITASILHQNDKMRIIRALEIFETTGLKKSEIKDDKRPILPFFAFSYDYDRETLYERISYRVNEMFEKGLIDEVKGLLNCGVLPSSQSMQGIGYKEVVFGLKEGFTSDFIKENVKLNTRHYAKRQITWFKRMDNMTYLKPDSIFQTTKLIKELIYGNTINRKAD